MADDYQETLARCRALAESARARAASGDSSTGTTDQAASPATAIAAAGRDSPESGLSEIVRLIDRICSRGDERLQSAAAAATARAVTDQVPRASPRPAMPPGEPIGSAGLGVPGEVAVVGLRGVTQPGAPVTLPAALAAAAWSDRQSRACPGTVRTEALAGRCRGSV